MTLPRWRNIISVPLRHYLESLVDHFATALSTYEAHCERSRLSRIWSRLFSRHPVVVAPTWTMAPWVANTDIEEGGIEAVAECAKYVLPASVLGFPALSLPIGEQDQSPTGVQLMADYWREDILLNAAEAIEGKSILKTPIDPVVMEEW